MNDDIVKRAETYLQAREALRMLAPDVAEELLDQIAAIMADNIPGASWPSTWST